MKFSGDSIVGTEIGAVLSSGIASFSLCLSFSYSVSLALPFSLLSFSPCLSLLLSLSNLYFFLSVHRTTEHIRTLTNVLHAHVYTHTNTFKRLSHERFNERESAALARRSERRNCRYAAKLEGERSLLLEF